MRKDEWGVDGEMKGVEDGLTGPGERSSSKRKKKNVTNNQIRGLKLLTLFMLALKIARLSNLRDVRTGQIKEEPTIGGKEGIDEFFMRISRLI